MLTQKLKETLRIASDKGYPYPKDLENGARFYPDEAFDDGLDLSAKTMEERHPNANICDCCSDPAEFMTCPDDDTELYICENCVTKYGMDEFVDRENVKEDRLMTDLKPTVFLWEYQALEEEIRRLRKVNGYLKNALTMLRSMAVMTEYNAHAFRKADEAMESASPESDIEQIRRMA